MKYPKLEASALPAAACLALMLIGAPSLVRSQEIDPALQQSWDFVQKAMPGLPYETLKAACEEGALTVYHGIWNEAEASRAAAFHERFPCINVDLLSLQVNELRERFTTETRANRYIADIVQHSDAGALNEDAKAGLLEHYVITSDKSYAEGQKNSGYWYPLRVALVGIAWNTDLVSDQEAEKLKQWEGITDPSWAGKGAVIDPSVGGVSALPWYMWSKLYGEGFFEKVAALKPRVFGGINPAAAALASGDIAVIFHASETGLLPTWSKGAPIKWSLPEPGVGPLTGQAISAHAPHPNAAKLFQEYSFSTEGYEAWQKIGGAPARLDYKDAREIAAQPWYHYPKTFFQYDPVEATKSFPEVVEMFRKTVGATR